MTTAPRAGEHDAVVVGAGPNGLVAAATLAGAGWRVLVLEAAPVAGGGTRSEELTLPGFVHDVCSAIHPLALASPALRDLPLAEHGLRWVQPDAPLAHPIDDGRAAVLERSVDATALGLGSDGAAYLRLMAPLVASGDRLVEQVLSPLSPPRPRSLPALVRFGWVAGQPAAVLARRRFATDEARGLLAGMAAHSMLSMRAPGTGGFGLLLGLLGHLVGWPMAEGGSQAVADALVATVVERGGEVVTGERVTSLDALPPARATLLDLTPHQLLRLDGAALPARYRRRLARYRYGPGVFKVDWALDGPIPWTSPGCHRAGTVHLGGSLEEVVASEHAVLSGGVADRPYVLLAQHTRFDPSRAPQGRHTAWAYCHVPNGSTVDMTARVEAQVERFAPGFRDLVLARHVMGPDAIEAHDANDVGGDISGGSTGLRQLVARPVASLAPWRTPVPGLYLCSSATPPGPGVHGMSGWHAARCALADAEAR